MKKFRILGILAILVIVGDFAISFTAGWQEERDSCGNASLIHA